MGIGHLSGNRVLSDSSTFGTARRTKTHTNTAQKYGPRMSPYWPKMGPYGPKVALVRILSAGSLKYCGGNTDKRPAPI